MIIQMIERHSIKDLPELTRKKNKYGVNPDKLKRTYKGVIYASVMEMKRAYYLDHCAGVIWFRQIPIILGDAGFKFIPDFMVLHGVDQYCRCFRIHFEDVKGFKTQRFNDIRKHWQAFGKFPLRIMTYKSGWREIERIEP